MDDGGTLAVSAGGKATGVTMTSGGALIADSGATVEGTNTSGKFSIDGISGQASGLLLENGGSFTVNAGGQASNTTVGPSWNTDAGCRGKSEWQNTAQ
ncbi:putative adhesin [Escherichia coli]|nr:putative adhesin [Escherichia coli]